MAGKFELKKSAGGKFMFTLKAANGRVILTSETYSSRAAAQDGIKSVKKAAGKDSSFERKMSKKGEPYFALKASNGEIVGSSEMYSSTSAMEGGVASVKENAPDAEIDDLTA
jgi:uncharacterized protein YegP (UPF0339 family)